MTDFKKKKLIVLLLMVSLAITGLLHYNLDPAPQHKLQSQTQLDSLIRQAIFDFQLGPHMRIQTIEVDSVFSRVNYRVSVPPGFSKTGFHMHLHKLLYPFKSETVGFVTFPDRHLDLHILYNDKVHRSVFLRTDISLLRDHPVQTTSP